MAYRDAHCHPLFAGREMQGAILQGCQTPDELIGTIQTFIKNNPELKWLDLSAIKPGFAIDRYALDRASDLLPIVVHTEDHHSICVNSKALEIAGFDKAAPKIEGGVFDISKGQPNGSWIHEYVAMQLIYAHQPKPTLENDLAALMAAQEKLLGYQVTEVVDAWIDPGMPEVFIEAIKRNILKIKTELCIRITPETTEQDWLFAQRTKQLVESLTPRF